jgi:hypothetical protein
VGDQSGVHRSQPPSGPRRGPRPPRRAPRRSRSHPRRVLAADPRSGSAHEGGPGRPGDARVAEDFRVPGVPRVLPDRATLDVSRGTQGSSGPGPGGRAPGAGARIQPLVERGTPRGVPRLQPERQRPDGRLGVLGAPDPGCPRVNAGVVGGGAWF